MVLIFTTSKWEFVYSYALGFLCLRFQFSSKILTFIYNTSLRVSQSAPDFGVWTSLFCPMPGVLPQLPSFPLQPWLISPAERMRKDLGCVYIHYYKLLLHIHLHFSDLYTWLRQHLTDGWHSPCVTCTLLLWLMICNLTL